LRSDYLVNPQKALDIINKDCTGKYRLKVFKKIIYKPNSPPVSMFIKVRIDARMK